MKAAVIGAGYAGLAAAFFLEKKGWEVSVFRWGKSASGASTGLLHPYPGKKALLSIRAHEGIEKALELFRVAGKKEAVFEKSGILRIAHTEEQRKKFQGDFFWMEEGITVYSRLYLEELRKSLVRTKVFEARIESLSELSSFDRIVVAAGEDAERLLSIPLKKTIGQSLLCRCRQKLPYALLSDCHITASEDPEYCLIGSTYEHTQKPDRKKALGLLEKAIKIYPPARDFTIEEVFFGVRASPKVGYLPIVKRIDSRTWALTGFGSRGLMYHALYAERLFADE